MNTAQEGRTILVKTGGIRNEDISYQLVKASQIDEHPNCLKVQLFGLSGGNPIGEFFSNAPVAEGEWVHVAVTYDGSNVKFYYNGILDGSIPASGALTIDSGDLGIGRCSLWHNQGFDGMIDDIRIYNTALTPQEIAAIAKNSSLPETGQGIKIEELE